MFPAHFCYNGHLSTEWRDYRACWRDNDTAAIAGTVNNIPGISPLNLAINNNPPSNPTSSPLRTRWTSSSIPCCGHERLCGSGLLGY